MTAKNEHTGHLLKTGITTDNYRNNYDAIFGKKSSSTAEQDPFFTPAPKRRKSDFEKDQQRSCKEAK
jgi:hypothetical protein